MNKLYKTGSAKLAYTFLVILFSFLGSISFAQPYVNGNLSTGATSKSGTAAPAGTTWSELQNDLGNTTVANSTTGTNGGITAGFTVADDFTVPSGQTWNITKFTFYGYQTNYASTTVSPFTTVRVRIHDGNPMLGPTNIVFGDLTTNRFAASANSNMYRIGNTLVPPTATNTARIIWTIEANAVVSLGAGTYWVEYQTDVTTAVAHFLPLSAVVNFRTQPGYNAIQKTVSSGVWAQQMDGGVNQSGTGAGLPVAMDMPFKIDYALVVNPPCTGTPAPGNTISSANPVCSGVTFNLSVASATTGSGVTYQWQSSPNNTTYTDIAGATSATLATTQTAATYYKLRVTCAGNPGFSNPLLVNMSPFATCYCIPPAGNCTFDDDIINVTFGTLNNNSLCSANAYGDYTALAAPNINIGVNTPLSVTIGPGGNDFVSAWIDYNQNGVFEASEYTNVGVTPGGVVTANIVVPGSALPGITRMRVRVNFNAAIPATNACTALAFGETEDYRVNLISAAGCTGTPAPGNTIATPATACPSVNFTLSTQNATTGTGIAYQWQSSPNGTTYTDIPGATASTYITSQTVATYYKVKVGCGTNTGTSNALQVTMTPSSGCYCIPTSTNCGLDDVITKVAFGTLNNTSACSPNGYADYTVSVAAPNISSGATTPIAVTVGPGGTEYVGVWIDYNQNGTFETTEFTAIGSGNGVVINGSITIPSTALLGQTRMRVRVRFNTALTGTDACLGYTYGETEDYKINIICSPSAFTSQPTSVATTCGSTAVFTATASNGPAYQWQISVNGGGTWTDVNNSGQYSGATTNSLTITGVNLTLNNNQYRVVITSACTAAINSNAAILTVTTPPAPSVTPTSATICAGGITPLSLVAGGTVVVNSAALSLAIPDNTPNGVSTNLTVAGIPAGATISSIVVAVNGTHTWDGDMVFVLKAPNNAILNLDYYLSATGGAVATTGFTNTRFSSAGVNPISSGASPYNGIYKVDGNIAVVAPFGPTGPTGFTPTVGTFPGLYSVPNGTWTLAMYDGGPADLGVLTSWSITIVYSFTPAPVGVWTPITGLFSDPAGNTAYIAGTSLTTVYAKPTVTTTYNVSAGITGCLSAPTPITVTVNTPASFTTQPGAVTSCAGATATFSGAATGTAPITYQWQLSTDNGVTWTNIAGATSSSYTVSDLLITMSGYKYRLAATSAAPCGPVFSNAANLFVRPLPSITISASPRTTLIPTLTTTLTAVASGPATISSYQWYRNGNFVSSTLAPVNTLVVDIDGIGDYSATATDANGCISLRSNTVTIKDSATGIVFLYPNPNKGKFKVRYYTEFYPAGTVPPNPVISTLIRFLDVYNAQGQRITHKPFSVTAPYGSMDVDLTPWGSGTYWIEINNVDGKRLVVGRAVVL